MRNVIAIRWESSKGIKNQKKKSECKRITPWRKQKWPHSASAFGGTIINQIYYQSSINSYMPRHSRTSHSPSMDNILRLTRYATFPHTTRIAFVIAQHVSQVELHFYFSIPFCFGKSHSLDLCAFLSPLCDSRWVKKKNVWLRYLPKVESPYRRFPQFLSWWPQNLIATSCDRFFHNSLGIFFFGAPGWLKGRILCRSLIRRKYEILSGCDKFKWNVCSSSAISLYHSVVGDKDSGWGLGLLFPHSPSQSTIMMRENECNEPWLTFHIVDPSFRWCFPPAVRTSKPCSWIIPRNIQLWF